jgi:KaiC/GvpD/RAD55 family RecA-like ATPase
LITFALRPIINGKCSCDKPDCSQAGKHPAERWKDIDPNRPELVPTASAGVGIATGARSGVFVIDLDVKNGIDGLANFQALGECPPTYTVATPSGGYHVYFKHPGFPVKTSASALARGVDVRGDGGYVVAPGSPHKNGGRYEVAADLPIADAPAWLLTSPELRHAGNELAQPVTDVEERFANVPKAWRIERAKAYLATQEPAIDGDGGDRHTWTLLTRAVHDNCLTDADMIADAFVEWNARCVPPWIGRLWDDKVSKVLHKSTTPWSTTLAMTYALETRKAAASAPVLERMTAAQRVMRIVGRDVTRLVTGLASIDKATRGGILLRKVVVIGGAPGAGKTALLVRLAYTWLNQGVPVGILASDEEADGLLCRLGQLHGLSRDEIERGDRATCQALAKWCESVPLLLFDGDEDGGSIEALSRDLRTIAAGRPSTLLVDSIQTARSETQTPMGTDMRAKIDAIVRALKHSAKVDGHLVVASSELSRAAYRNKDQAENANALAAFKESGGIEYGVSLALVLSSRQGTSELVDAAIVKNRLGSGKPEFMLKLDHERADVTETTAEDAKAIDPLYFLKLEIKAEIEKACGTPLSKRQIGERVGGRTGVAFRALNELIEAKELHQTKGGVRFPLPGDPGFKNDVSS